MFERHLLIFLFIFTPNSSCVINALYDIAKEVRTFYLLLDETDLRSIIDATKVNENPSNLPLIKQIHKIYEQLDEIERFTDSKVITNWLEVMKLNSITLSSLQTMQLFITNIHDNYRKFNDYVVKGQLEDLVKSVFPNIESDIIMIRKIMTNAEELLSNDRSLIVTMTRSAMIQYEKMCHTSQIMNEILVQIFRIVMIVEIKTHVMLGFANRYQYVENKGWDDLNSLACSQFQTYFATYVNILRENLEVVKNLYLRSCDPENGTWILNDNCFELEGTARAIIFRYQTAKCPSQTCNFMDSEALSECKATYYEERDECSSLPTDCTELGPVETRLSKKSPRRLLYMNTTVLGLLGKNYQHSNDTGYMMSDGEEPNHEYFSCSCNCYGNYSKISLLMMESRVESNRVITGLRFIHKNNTLHIQLKEGLLGPYGYINQLTNKWRPIPKFLHPSQTHSIDKENRIFFLDNLRLPSKYVLTGIEFHRTRRGTVTGFEIRITGVLFNYKTGELDHRRRYRPFSQPETPGQPLSFKPINSIETILPHEASSENLKYVQLQRSLLIHDFGQSTLPLFDAVPVVTNPPSRLNGVGIFHKGVNGYAGFISLRLYGMQYDKYFDDFKSAHIMEDVVILD